MVWLFPSLFVGLFSFFFNSVGMIWVFSLSFLLLFLCKDISCMSLFFCYSSSWMGGDVLSVLMEILVVLVFMLSLVCSVKDYFFMKGYTFSGIESMVSLVSVVCMVFFAISGWMSFYFFFEFSLIPTLWLILKWGYQPERLQAGVFMMMYTVGASLPLLVVLVYMYMMEGSDSFLLMKMVMVGESVIFSWCWVFCLLAFLVKVPIYVFHGWLPKAHVEAPLAGSMVLAGVLLKLGGFGLIRMMWLIKMYVNEVFVLIVGLSIWGGVISSMISIFQSDMKSIIAYSSVGHMSMVVGSVMSCYPVGKLSGVCMMFAHGLCSPCMFALAGSAYDWSRSRSVVMNKSVLQVFPMFTLFWFVFSIMNMGCPPSLNYFSEVIMFSVMKGFNLWFILPLGLMCQISCVYSMLLYGYLNHGGVSFYNFTKSSLSDRYVCSFLFCGLAMFLGFVVMDFFFC